MGAPRACHRFLSAPSIVFLTPSLHLIGFCTRLLRLKFITVSEGVVLVVALSRRFSNSMLDDKTRNPEGLGMVV